MEAVNTGRCERAEAARYDIILLIMTERLLVVHTVRVAVPTPLSNVACQTL